MPCVSIVQAVALMLAAACHDCERVYVRLCNTLPHLLCFRSDYNCVYAGQGAQKMKRQFKQARKHKKAIIFIDEVSLPALYLL
jgi:ATPase family associated with various cellular activities (AAA)